MSFLEMARQERFMATVYAINTLLIQKGVYSGDEFDQLFIQWIDNKGSQAKQGTIGEEIGHIRAIALSLEDVSITDPRALSVFRWQMSKAIGSICDALDRITVKIEETERRMKSQVPNYKSDR